MQSIGERLREARMRQKLDITEVEGSTKIRAKYIRALENEEFELLPGPTFVKTFLRTYAEYLGLDAHLLVEEYRSQHEPREPEVQPFVTPSGREGRRARPPRGPPGAGTAVIVVVVVLLLAFVILGLTGGTKKAAPPPSAQPAPATTPSTSPPATRRRHAVATTVVLRVSPVGPTYICVDHGAGTRSAFEGIINSPMTFRARRLRINSGKSSVGLVANNRRVRIPQSALPIGYDFTPRTARPLPARPRPCVP